MIDKFPTIDDSDFPPLRGAAPPVEMADGPPSDEIEMESYDPLSRRVAELDREMHDCMGLLNILKRKFRGQVPPDYVQGLRDEAAG
ncbi:hypothetical protein AVEN_49009-1 [Araneus ventricosus]|uniref:Uncharacterized protein n=1 Tax=Araneus ventricosus TaxID=182803 RepID=A0A4Y2AIQ1_ARAVE|nr:hypothetical protein AVEN_49009-1 [Araneus ventricosus]